LIGLGAVKFVTDIIIILEVVITTNYDELAFVSVEDGATTVSNFDVVRQL